MQRTALYNSRKTETQLKSKNNFTVEREMLQKCLPKILAYFLIRKVTTTNKS
jgi:hypothetical protein